MLDFLWSRERLWALDLPVERVAVESLRWQLALPWWSLGGVPFAVSPDEVRADPLRYRVQHDRTMAADLSFPAHVLAHRCGLRGPPARPKLASAGSVEKEERYRFRRPVNRWQAERSRA